MQTFCPLVLCASVFLDLKTNTQNIKKKKKK